MQTTTTPQRRRRQKKYVYPLSFRTTLAELEILLHVAEQRGDPGNASLGVRTIIADYAQRHQQPAVNG